MASRYFDIKLTSGTAQGPYTIYYNSTDPWNIATVYNTGGLATGVTYSTLTTGTGLRVSIPDTSTSIIVYNPYCPNTTYTLPTPTPTPTPSITRTQTPTPSVTATNTRTPTPTQTPTQTSTPTQTPTQTHTPTQTPTPTPTYAAITATFTPSSVSCNGGSDGSIVVSGVTGGNGSPFQTKLGVGGTYQTITTTRTYSGLTAGSYTIYIRDVDLKEVSYSVTVTEPTVNVASVTTITEPCNGASDGQVQITSSGGTWPKTYELYLDNSLPYDTCGGTLIVTYTGVTEGGTYNVLNLSSGGYCLKVTDANGCVVNSGITILVDEDAVYFEYNATNCSTSSATTITSDNDLTSAIGRTIKIGSVCYTIGSFTQMVCYTGTHYTGNGDSSAGYSSCFNCQNNIND